MRMSGTETQLRPVAAAMLALCLVVAIGTGAWAITRTSSDTGGDPGVVNAEKAAQQAVDRKFDAANAQLAEDPDAVARVVRQKEQGDRGHRAKLRATEPTPQAWPTGIVENGEAPISGTVFLGTNEWTGKVGSDYLVVHAGRSGSDPAMGRVFAVGPDGQSSYMLDLPGTGALRIVDASGSRLVLLDAHGARHVLDAMAGTWVDG